MTITTQKLGLVERRWDALLEGKKLDTIRYNETSISEGFLLYESFPSACRYAVVYVTNTSDIELRDVLQHTKDKKRKPDEESLLKKITAHYPDISLDSVVSYTQHLSVEETKKKFPNEVKRILEEAYFDLDSRPMPQVIFFANPFGLGPAGKAFAVLDRAKELLECEWYFAGGPECKAIGNFENVSFISIDERDPIAIEELLASFKRPFVVSSLNRFAVTVAKRMDIPNALIDGLTWMWEPIPDQLLLSDIYFALRFPGVEKKVENHEHIKIVDYIAPGRESIEDIERKGILVHLGGMWNPLTKSTPLSYLRLISEVLNRIVSDDPITVCGSEKAIDFLFDKVQNERMKFETFSKKEFENHLSHARKLITTPGLTSSMEAFSLDTPTSFLPPTNLSQLKIFNIFREYGATKDALMWDEYGADLREIETLSEHDAILELEKLAAKIYSNPLFKDAFVEKLARVFDRDPSSKIQHKFISDLGDNGADQILSELQKCWHLLPVK